MAVVNEQHIADNPVALVPKPSSYYPSLWLDDMCWMPSAFVLTPAFRLGFVMTTEMGFSPDGNGKKAWHSLKL